MLCFSSSKGLTLGIIGFILLAVPGTPVSSQSSPSRGSPQPLSRAHWGIGFVGNVPDAIAGAAGYIVVPRLGGIGIYLDAKFDVDDPSDDRGFDPRVTVDQVEGLGGAEVKSESSWWSVNAAFVRPVSPFLMIYVGAGYAHRKVYGLYNVDPSGEVGLGGVVWAESPGKEEKRLNLMAGIMMRLTSRVTSQFGFETRPQGVTAGATLRFPPW
ncbi:MAG: hypothetical protein MUO50_01875 [Longimicrobiales bacterium]|nr:hypothetical protein [Longimicrobiales bacterium]